MTADLRAPPVDAHRPLWDRAATLAWPAYARLTRTRATAVMVAAWYVLAWAVALFVRARGTPNAADHVLVDVVGAWVLPIVVYLVTGATFGPASVRGSVAPLSAWGAEPWQTALAFVGVAAAAGCVAGALLTATTAMVGHGPTDPPRLLDACVSAYAGGLAGIAYACFFSCGVSIGRRGGARAVFLVADWIAGSGDGAPGLLTPRAHVRNLLGGTPPLDWSEHASAATLVAIAIAAAAIAASRARPAR